MTLPRVSERDVTPYDALQELGRAIERRVSYVFEHPETDDINLDPRVIAARAALSNTKATPGPTKILNIISADGGVRAAIRETIAERLVAVTE